jgi:hypothetical protein
MLGDKFLITTPDFDHSTRIKLMLIGFDQAEIEHVVSRVQVLPHTLTLYTYGDDDRDAEWCLLAAKTSTAVLINCTTPSSIDMLKGYLLAQPNSSAYGDTKGYTLRTYFDVAVWLTDVLLEQQKNLQPNADR